MEIVTVHPDIINTIKSFDVLTQAKIVRLTELLEMREYRLGMPYSKKIASNLYELRIKSIQNVRIFYMFHNEQIVLLHVIAKKTQKLIKKDIEKALMRAMSIAGI